MITSTFNRVLQPVFQNSSAPSMLNTKVTTYFGNDDSYNPSYDVLLNSLAERLSLLVGDIGNPKRSPSFLLDTLKGGDKRERIRFLQDITKKLNAVYAVFKTYLPIIDQKMLDRPDGEAPVILGEEHRDFELLDNLNNALVKTEAAVNAAREYGAMPEKGGTQALNIRVVENNVLFNDTLDGLGELSSLYAVEPPK